MCGVPEAGGGAIGGEQVSRFFMPEVDGVSPCAYCVHARNCIPASALVPSYWRSKRDARPDLRKWWLVHRKRVRPKETEQMRRGLERHRELTSDVTENLEEVFEELGRVGGSIKWTARVCSPAEGIRGMPDWIESRRVDEDRVYHHVVELKAAPTAHRKYFVQACAYGMILGYRFMLANSLHFYERLAVDRGLRVDVDFEVRYYDRGNSVRYSLVRNWRYVHGSPEGAEFVFGVRKIRKRFLGLERVRDISEIPRCGYCPPWDRPESALNGGPVNPAELCEFWEWCRDDLWRQRNAPRVRQRTLKRWVRPAKSL